MFNTDFNHFLQKIDWVGFYWFMEAISALGTVALMTLMVYVVVTGVEFKRGIWIANIFFYTLIATIALKQSIDFPRPYAVDNTLNTYGAAEGQNLREELPAGFFEIFSDSLLASYRALEVGQWGLPSGHTSMITALFLGSALFFRKTWLYALAGTIILLTMISRMYLARHFLGDTLGGFLLGLVAVLVASRCYKKFGEHEYSLIVLSVLPLVFLFFSQSFSAFQTGGFIGFNVAALTIVHFWGYPSFSDKMGIRVIGALMFFVIGYLGIYIVQRLSFEEFSFLSMLIFAFTLFSTFIVSAFACKRWKIWVFDK